MTESNEAFARVVIDAQLAGQGWDALFEKRMYGYHG
jgi:hypothetical protein